ncbi:hypothetical protein ACIQV3_22370 [Streptomyces sp. NPDC099050]|uniref:hypothetical protein n=1 Tax=Streptomyces sp. NPDC099050 TaxID=3366100 RepID=UPI00382A31CA
MSHIIAGDPAPTNTAAAIRADILAGLRIAESGSIGDETPEDLLARYDALKRAEVLAEAIEAADAEYEPQDITAPRSPYNEGVSDAVSALYRLAQGGTR